LVANAAIVGPIIIATAIRAAAFAISPEIPKMSIPQLAMPKARTARIIAIIMPMMLTTRSFADEAAFSTIYIPQSDYSLGLDLKILLLARASPHKLSFLCNSFKFRVDYLLNK